VGEDGAPAGFRQTLGVDAFHGSEVRLADALPPPPDLLDLLGIELGAAGDGRDFLGGETGAAGISIGAVDAVETELFEGHGQLPRADRTHFILVRFTRAVSNF
jgi:hypothetical protein